MEGTASATGSKTSDGHPGRVLSLSYLGSAHAPAVISTTSSGFCGVWNVDSLADPAISCIPSSPSCDHKGAHYPALSAAAFISGPVGSSSNIVGSMSIEGIVGRVDGALLVYNRGGGFNSQRLAKGTAAGGQGHSAPITCIATPVNGGSVFRDLAVTTSMDWGLKLWSLKNLDVICSFDDGSDEMTCAAFNPINPCLFAFADVSGSVGLRAIDRSLDAGLVGSAQVDVAVNCMEWSCDGKLLALGGLNGEVRILKLSESLLDYSRDKDEVVSSVLAATQSELSFT